MWSNYYLMFLEDGFCFQERSVWKSASLVYVIREHKLSDDLEYTCAFTDDDRSLYFPVCGIQKPYILVCGCKRTDLAWIKW
jgi:hypothetical protein